MGSPNSATCYNNFAIIQGTWQELGIPLEREKLEGQSHSLTFLGIELDTIHMEARFANDKLKQIRTLLTSWLTPKKATILSLVGVLQHASKVVRPGRTFTARMYSKATGIKELHYFTCLNKDFSFRHTYTGGTPLSVPGMVSVYYIWLTSRPLLIFRLRLMHQALGDVELSFQISGPVSLAWQN